MAGVCAGKAFVQHLCGRFALLIACISSLITPGFSMPQILLSKDFPVHAPAVNSFFRSRSSVNSAGGFTLLEVLMAVAILGIAITVVLQLFSANLRAISVSGDYVSASTSAEAKMRELLSEEELEEQSSSEVTTDGYRIDTSITETLKERTETLEVRLLEVAVTVRWLRGGKERSFTLRSLKVVERVI
ncbi:MAG: type II secretion system protein [Nitrospirota bacterium]